MQAQKVTNRERVVQLIMLTEGLSDIIDKEVDLLANRRPSALKEFEEEKTRMAKVYAAEMTLFRKDKSLRSGVPEGLLQDLTRATGNLRERLDKQALLLTGLKTVSERMVQAIAQEVVKTRGQTSYGSNAAYPGTSGRAAAFAVNRVA